MKRTILCSLLFCIHLMGAQAQSRLTDFIQPGDFQVGYMDTLLFDWPYTYTAYNYTGNKPYVVQVWFPLTEKIEQPEYLTFKDFFEMPASDTLASIQTNLQTHYRDAVIRDCLEENLSTGEANTYGDFSYQDILALIGKIETRSIQHPAPNAAACPVIVYHHGSQSFPFENYAMAEYFASRGFIFVAANYHLPYANTIYGLKPFDQLQKGEDEQSLLTIVEYAKTLSSSSAMFFIGHSWGAQMGFRTFAGDTAIKGFISLETTLEFKTDEEKIKEYWPEVYQKVFTEKAYYPFPILMCAATGNAEPFLFLSALHAPYIAFASTDYAFEHNAYVSAFYLRYFLDPSIVQTDSEILHNRLCIYAKHLAYMNAFIQDILNHTTKPKQETSIILCE